ncbi:exodeoxyribonuclease V subunit alpha [Arhodomonas sp. AD133]|uniref:exodeoxyribonuclease V subunit alpha n=1 Tax=Arhodomonas sp. AD133 TaxID=3415009 RepID=UPI003EBDEF2A
MHELIAWIDTAADAGWLRPIDRALAQFVQAHRPADDPLIPLSAALVSHQLGRGHICMDLAALATTPDEQLALPPEHADATVARPSALLAGVDADDWRERLLASDAVDTGDGNAPLVIDGSRLYLRRYWAYEQAVASALGQRLGVERPPPEPVREALERYFGPGDGNADWQRIAAALAVDARFTVISGGPGTGKTTTVARLLAVVQERRIAASGAPLRVHLAAPTGKAAARLGESLRSTFGALPCPEPVRDALPNEVTTVHRLLGARADTRGFRHHRHNPLHTDLVVLDEASMVDLELMAALLDALPASARLILLGDKDQLASVEAGAVLGDLCAGAEIPGYGEATRAWLAHAANTPDLPGDRRGGLAEHIALLRHSYRFDAGSGIGRLAGAVNAGDGIAAREALAGAHEDVAWRAVADADDPAFARMLTDGYADYLSLLRDGTAAPAELLTAFNRFRVLCATRQGPWGVARINQLAEEALRAHGLAAASDGWYSGRPVMVTRNDRRLGLYNGDVGIALPAPDSPRLRVYFEGAPGEAPRAVLPSRLTAVETVFAMTVHKSQGSEFDHVAMVLPEHPGPLLTRELLYTGITRARRALTLLGADPEVLVTASTRRIHRASGLAQALQHYVGNLMSPGGVEEHSS